MKGWKTESGRRIFISYRRTDAQGFAGRLNDSLNDYFGAGRVFRDIDSIGGGAKFGTVINEALADTDAMIVLIGRGWLAASDEHGARRLDDPEDWVGNEIAATLERDIPVFPVLVDGAEMPRAEELPEALQSLATFNAVSISDHRWREDVTRLAKVIALDVPGSAAERKLHRVNLWIAFSLLASIALSAGVLVINTNRAIEVLQSGLQSNALDFDLARELDTAGLIVIQDNRPAEVWLLTLGMSGVTFLFISLAVFLLHGLRDLVDPSKRHYLRGAIWVGLIGTGASFISLVFISPDQTEPLPMFFASTVIATAMLGLMSLSGLKPK